MKTLEQIVESCISSVQGGVFTDEGNILSGKYEEKVHEARATVLREKFAQVSDIHPDWIQRFYPEYDEFMQDNKCVTVFNCPAFVDFSTRDGLVYVGSSDFPQSFNRAYNMGDLATMMRHQIYNRNRIVALYEGGKLYLYSEQKIENPVVVGVFARPTDVKSFSKFSDNYPVDPQSCMAIEDNLVQRLFNEIRTPSDGVSDSSAPSITGAK
jgi:hypothetical protein